MSNSEHYHYFSWHSIPGEIIAGWEAEMYAVNESDLRLSICAVQTANIERDVPVTFSTLSQSAISECHDD